MKTQFDAFWEIYPRKVGKGAAQKAFNKLNEFDRRDVLAAVVEYTNCVKQWPAYDRRFIPHPTTWLNQRRWEDDRSEWRRRNGRNFNASIEQEGKFDHPRFR